MRCLGRGWRLRTSASDLRTFLIAFILFGSEQRLRGPFLYDDLAAVRRNPVVGGTAPLARVWALDFWGHDELHSPSSHKSFRPLVTLSYRLNFWAASAARRRETADAPFADAGLADTGVADTGVADTGVADAGFNTFGYHLLNALLHATNAALVRPVVGSLFASVGCFGERVPTAAALLFALHPIHAEAVQNIVGRAELLMGLFYQLGFLAYARVVGRPSRARGGSHNGRPLSLLRAILALVLALGATTGATLCKETGVTLPLLCALWDLFAAAGVRPRDAALRLTRSREGRRRARAALARSALLAAGCVAICVWRLHLNGVSPPSMSIRQNLPAMQRGRLARLASIPWVWLEYLFTFLVPVNLCCDWSDPAIPPITTLFDSRVPALLVGGIAMLGLAGVALGGRGPLLLSCALFWAPFILASNLVFAVGTCKAERLLYVPSVGACAAVSLALARCAPAAGARRAEGPTAAARRLAIRIIFGLGFATLGAQCLWYSLVWTEGSMLWARAVEVQSGRPQWLRAAPAPNALAELGMQLSWAGRHAESAEVLERQGAIAEATLDMWTNGGGARNVMRDEIEATGLDLSSSLDLSGYIPLTVTLHSLGRTEQALAVAERCNSILLRLGSASGEGNNEKPEQLRARCLAVGTLPLAIFDPERAESLAGQVVRATAGQDGVVNDFVGQLAALLKAQRARAQR